RLLCAYRGYRFDVFAGLDRRPGGPLYGAFAVPPGLRVVHVVGFPLARHLGGARARRGYRRVAPQGPRDGGGFLLGDVGRLPGTVLPVWGADHYLRPAWDIDPLIERLLALLIRQTQPAARPQEAPA